MKTTKPKVKPKKNDEFMLMGKSPYEYYEFPYTMGVHVVVGRPATGKTNLAIGCIDDCIMAEYPIAYVSLDMEKKFFFERLEKKIPPSTINKAMRSNLFFYSAEKEVTKLLPYLQSLRSNGVRAVIIDFVQLLNVNGKALDTDSLVAILSAFALKHQMSIVLLCQLMKSKEDLYPFAQTIHIIRKGTEK
ncbi:MAG: hypothetical protein J6Q22_10730 [Prevotella sp.]|nr:hypothetical protein [Prevotella sp.]